MTASRLLPAVLLFCLAAGPIGSAWGQAAPAPQGTEALRVFLDCHGPCDFDYVRREITYVDWVRDRQDADVHLLLTTQGTGGGGDQYTLKVIGLRGFAALEDEFVFTSRQSDSFDERRALIVQRIGLALARFAARGPIAGRLRLTFTPLSGADSARAQQPTRDPWNLWVFTIEGNAFMQRESQFRSVHLSGMLRARRITEKWKFGTNIRGSRSTSRFELDSNEVVNSKQSDYTYEVLLVRSLGDHWSMGLNGGGRRSSRDNYDLLVRIAPGLEYDIFPFRESSRRQFVFVYEVALILANYTEETIFSKLSESRLAHALTAAVEAIQPWGRVEAQITGSAYLNNWGQNRVTLRSGLGIRLARGLELELNAFYARVRDQLSLPKEGATDDEVLLRLKQLKTSYEFFGAIGLSYTFGSKFNNVVNPRFNTSVFDF